MGWLSFHRSIESHQSARAINQRIIPRPPPQRKCHLGVCETSRRILASIIDQSHSQQSRYSLRVEIKSNLASVQESRNERSRAPGAARCGASTGTAALSSIPQKDICPQSEYSRGAPQTEPHLRKFSSVTHHILMLLMSNDRYGQLSTNLTYR
jgi:hypothetical protein